MRAGRSLTIAAALLAVACAALVASAGAASGDCVGTAPVVCTYTATGSEQQFTVPAGVTSLHVVAIGGQGGTGDSGAVGGFGDRLEGDLAVTSGATLYVEVGGNGDGGSGATGGGGGFNGGAVGGNTGPCDSNGGGGGGGGSDIRTVAGTDGTALNSRLFSAGGGGGGGGFNSGAVGGNAGSPGTSATGGGGGGAGTSGGAAGGGGSGGGVNGGGGSLGTGGAGGFGSCDGGGGGAGGKYGGGGGGGNSDFQASGGGGGGGGSSDTGSLTGGSQATDNTGTPSITISYTVPLVSSASLSCHYNTGSTHNSDEFTNGGDSANVPHGTTQSYVVHCVVSTSGTVTKWKVQGGLTNSMKKAPSYSFLSDTCPHDTTHKIDTSKNGNVVTDAGTSLSSTCDIEVLVTGASWKATGLQNLTGSWSLSYKDSSGAGQSTQAPETPLQVQST